MASSSLLIAFMATLLFSSTMGHSQMRCAKYNTATGACEAPIRNENVSFEQEAYDMSTGTSICQSPMTNPITASYANGTGCPSYAGCPDPMGTFTSGETFTVMWLARNHATPDQTPGNISLYLSPPESLTQGADATLAQFQQNKFCTSPFISCNGQNGNFVQCYASCTLPANTVPGIYTIWWKWAWPGHTYIYSTCADVFVVASSSSAPVSTPSAPVAPVAPVSTPSAPVSTPTPVTPAPVSTPVAPVSTPTPVAPVSTPVAPVSTPTPVQSSSTSTSSSSSSSTTCSGNTMKCLTSTSYSMCNRGTWGPSQNCGPQTMCTPTGDYIYCVASSSPVSTPVAPVSTPVAPVQTPTAPVATPVTPVATPTPSSSTPSSSTVLSGSCATLGNQQCVGTNKYQTCGNGRNGPEWAAPQSCQAGLSCHPSSTANNVYCY